MLYFFRNASLCAVLATMSISLNAQTYEAKYKMNYESALDSTQIDTLSNIIDLLNNLPVKIVINYTVITDGKYLVLKAEQEESSSVFGLSLNLILTDTLVLFDLVKQLVYFPGSKKYQRIKKYELNQDSIIKNKYFINGFGNTYFAELSTDINKCILPAVFFSNNKYGVEKIHTPDFTIYLVAPVKKISRKLSFKEYFDKMDKVDIPEEYSFFQNK